MRAAGDPVIFVVDDDRSVRDETLAGMGMESLQAIALQYQILDQVGADVTIEELLGRRDVAALATFIASGLAPEVVARVAPESRRLFHTGSEGARLLIVGGAPGKAYEAQEWSSTPE